MKDILNSSSDIIVEENLKDCGNNNKIDGKRRYNPNNIIFKGKNNYVKFVTRDHKEHVDIDNSTITFFGDNSLVYICENLKGCPHIFNIEMYGNNYCSIGFKTIFGGFTQPTNLICTYKSNIYIGHNCLIADGVDIKTSDYYPIYNSHDTKIINKNRNIYIGDHCWIGLEALIQGNSKIGSGAIVGAKSIVSNLIIPSNEIWAGLPAKQAKENIFHLNDILDNTTSDEYNRMDFIYNLDEYAIEFEAINQDIVKETTISGKINCLCNYSNSKIIGFKNRYFIKNSNSKKLNESDIIYMIVTDRFKEDYNSWKKKDEIWKKEHPEYDKESLTSYNGGSWNGIKDYLYYIQNLGVTAIWISPISKNVPIFMDEAAFKEASYSGYMTQDYSSLNEHFGTKQDLQSLVEEAEKRGIKIILDVVPNHTADYFISGSDKWKSKTRRPAPPFDDIKYYHHAGLIDSDDWNDPVKYRKGDLGFLADLDQNNVDVKKALIRAYNELKNLTKASGFRCDAAKCMDFEFLKEFQEEMDIPIFGEVFVNQVSEAQEYQKYIWSVLDFPLYHGIKNVFAYNQDFNEIKRVLDEDINYIAANRLITFIDNHDQDRFLSITSDNFAKYRLALAFLFTCRGIPCVYYGSEQSLYGSDLSSNDAGITSKYNREMMKETQFSSRNLMYSFINRLARMRNHYSCLQDGIFEELKCENSFYAFSRHKKFYDVDKIDAEPHEDIIYIAINNGNSDKSIQISKPKGDEKLDIELTNLLDTSEKHTMKLEGDRFILDLVVKPNSVVILHKSDKWVSDNPYSIFTHKINFEVKVDIYNDDEDVWLRGTKYPLFSQNGFEMTYNSERNSWNCCVERFTADDEFDYKFVLRNRYTSKDTRWSPCFHRSPSEYNCIHNQFDEEITPQDCPKTTIKVKMNTGWGNSLILRGTYGSLFTKNGVKMENKGEQDWEAIISDIPKGQKCKFRIVLVGEKIAHPSERWLQEENEILGGEEKTFTPPYYAKAYIYKSLNPQEKAPVPGTKWKIEGKTVSGEPAGYPVFE